MDHKKIREIIVECINQIGIIFEDEDVESDFNLSDLVTDSIEFVQFIVELEERFKLEVPDELLNSNILESINGLVELIDNLIS